MFIIVILFSIKHIETCYGYYRTESYHFQGFPNFFFFLVDILVSFFGILAELVL